MKKDILTLLDLTNNDFENLFKLAIKLKKEHKNGIISNSLAGKTIGLVFDKASTRTRVSFETAMLQLGGTPIYINTRDTQIARNEPVRDTARVLAGYLDGIIVRTYSQILLEEYADFADVPVINALTDLYHPCQVLSDLLTIIEYKGGYKDIKITWVGDGNNVANSWINAAAVIDLNLVLACPEGYHPDNAILENAYKKNRGNISITSDPFEAVKDADVIYTDVWASMGQENEYAARKHLFQPFQVNKKLVKNASKDVIVMHCLPAHRGEEISEEMLEGQESVVWDQAENKLHMTKAVLQLLMTA